MYKVLLEVYIANKPGGTSVMFFATGTGSKTNEIQHCIGPGRNQLRGVMCPTRLKLMSQCNYNVRAHGHSGKFRQFWQLRSNGPIILMHRLASRYSAGYRQLSTEIIRDSNFEQ